MNGSRKLMLKREVLSPIDTDQLRGVVGGATRRNCGSAFCSDTCFSCLTYISCYPEDCAS